MNIDINTKKSEGVERTLEISVPSAEVEAAEEKVARRYASQANIPGFRPGKAPAAMIRRKFAEAIRSDALEALVQAAFKEVVEREKIKVAGQPHIHNLEYSDGKPLTFELHIEVSPEIELARTSGFRIAKPAASVSEEQVSEQIDYLRDQKAAWAPLNERATSGDMVRVRLAMAEDGAEPGEGEEYSITIGRGQAIAGIEELALEASVGETVTKDVAWPEDFPDEAQRGKTKKVALTLLEAKRKVLPELDDSFAREVGDFDNVKELRDAVAEDLKGHAERTATAELRQKLLDELITANPFAIPKAWVGQLVRTYAESYQVPEAELDKFAQEFWPLAEKQVRRDVIVETIAEQNNLAATEADIDARVSEVAAKRNADPGQVYASLQKGGRMGELERGITEDKVFAWLLERNTVE
jgi:trigger factor